MAGKFPVDTGNLKVIDSLQTGDVWVLKELPDDAFFTIGAITTDWDGDPMAYGNKHKHPEISPHDHLGNALGRAHHADRRHRLVGGNQHEALAPGPQRLGHDVPRAKDIVGDRLFGILFHQRHVLVGGRMKDD